MNFLNPCPGCSLDIPYSLIFFRKLSELSRPWNCFSFFLENSVLVFSGSGFPTITLSVVTPPNISLVLLLGNIATKRILVWFVQFPQQAFPSLLLRPSSLMSTSARGCVLVYMVIIFFVFWICFTIEFNQWSQHHKERGICYRNNVFRILSGSWYFI